MKNIFRKGSALLFVGFVFAGLMACSDQRPEGKVSENSKSELEQSSSIPVFMSEDHVSRMNRLLAVDEASKAETAKLDRKYVMAYELTDAPGGKTEWWLMNFDPERGVYFELKAPPSTSDLTLTGDYKAYMRFMMQVKAKTANADEQPVTYSGNEQLMEIIGAAFAVAYKAAVMESKIPDV